MMDGAADGVTTVATNRLTLRPMRADDAEALLDVFGDPRVMASFGVAPFDRAQMDRWIRRNLEHHRRHGFGLFSVILKASGLLIGDCGLERMEIAGADEVELGYDIRSDHWGLGLATEAATAVRDHAFTTLGIPRVVSLIRVENEASRRVAEKIGMRLETETVRDGHRYAVYVCAARDR